MAIQLSNDNRQPEKEQQLTFLQKVFQLSVALKKKFLAYMAVCILVAAIAVSMMIVFKDLRFSIGFLIALYIAYMGMDIVWSAYGGKIIQQQMVCLKTTKHPILNCLEVIFQEIGTEKTAEESIHSFYIPNTKKNKLMFTQSTVMDIFYRPDTPSEITAWAILGVTTEKI